MPLLSSFFFFFFFNDTATTEIYTLSLHDALPISISRHQSRRCRHPAPAPENRDRKSTRLNSSHANISYAVFCLKKKQKKHNLLGPLTQQRKHHRDDVDEIIE